MPLRFRKLVLAAGSTALALIAVEVAFRGYQRLRFRDAAETYRSELFRLEPGTDHLYGLHPGARRDTRTEHPPYTPWSYAVGPDGYRATRDGAEGDLRALAIGDSYTFGWGVADDESYPAALEKLLDGVDLINGGIPGHNTFQVASHLSARIDEVAPDLVIYGFVPNDAEPPRGVPRDPDERYAEAGSWVLEDLKLRLGIGRSRLHRQRPYPEHFEPGAPEGERCREGLGEIAGLCTARGIPLLVFLFPDATAFGAGGYPYEALHATVAQWCDELEVPVHDLAPRFAGRTASELGVPGDGHPNAAMLAEFARAITPHVSLAERARR